MDFIPKSLMNEVKTLKKTFQQPGKGKTGQAAPRETSGSKDVAVSGTSSETRSTPKEDVRSVLTSATRRPRTLEDIVLPDSKSRPTLPAAPPPGKPSNMQTEIPAVVSSVQKPRGLPVSKPEIRIVGDTATEPVAGPDESADGDKIITTRKEVAKLKRTMQELLKTLDIDDEQLYPTEMHQFMYIIKEENKIYDTVFKELIRQVTVNMIERGE
ncbi:Axonemal dynein light chain domain-containing protein 1, partial [Kappamyces sp. JEL0680]